MKLYAIQYNFNVISFSTLSIKEVESKTETFSDVTEFINRVKYLTEHGSTDFGQKTVENLKVFSGECEELNVSFVLNPF